MSHGARLSLGALMLLGGLGWAFRRSLRPALAQLAQQRKTLWVFISIIALLPMLHMTWIVRHYGINVPTLDDWEMAPLISHAHTGQVKFSEIFAQQQEGRTILPKLIFILSAADGNWDVRDQMMLSVLACWLTAAGLFILLQRTALKLPARAVCLWLIALTLFTPAQFELWIFASGFPSFLPALFLVAGLVVIGTRLTTGWKFFLCAAFATASSFSLPHGLLAWALTFPVLIMMKPSRRWPWWLGGWLVLCALCAAFYFWGYHKPAYLPAFAPTVSLFEYARFFLQFLGGGLAYALKNQPSLAAEIFGAGQLLLFLFGLGFTARRSRDRAFLARVLPWFALGMYALGSAFLATLGRVGYGAPYALASRYVTFSIYLTIAVMVLLAIIAQESMQNSARTRASVLIPCAILLLAYLIPYRVCAANTLYFLRTLSAKDRLAHAAVLFSGVIDTSDTIIKTTYPSARAVKESAADLDRLHLLRPRLAQSNRVSAFAHSVANGKDASGACETVTATGESSRASGWALLNEKHRQPDCVAMAYQNPGDGEWIACAISDSVVQRADLDAWRRHRDQLWAGWTLTFPRNVIPAGAKVSFWAVDADGPAFYRLDDGGCFAENSP